ncbi:ATP-binding protein [Pelomonas aquatica]|uniref:sensor histidine kinase n=1 Tax=Pelomonas aquatica TaxID=431058 RepID=UPI00286B4E48|nr:ATP-binding protein [Pelomonas aquatica]
MRFGTTSLRRRLLWVFIAGVALSAGLVALGVLVLAEPFNQYMLRSGVQSYAEAIAHKVRFDAQGRPVSLDDQIGPWLFDSLSQEVMLRIVDEEGRVGFAPDPRPQPQPLAPGGERFDPDRRHFVVIRDGVAMHAATVPLEHSGRRWYAQFAASDRLVLRMRNSVGLPALRQGILATCAVFLLVFLITIHVTLRRALAPLSAASAAARRITPRTLDERLDEAVQPIEIRPMVQAFNAALDRLQHGFQVQQAFLASAAHELKTPLALIRVQVEMGPDDERRRFLLADVDRMARQVQQLLMLAEVSEPQNYRIEPIDPRATVQEAFDFMARVAGRYGVHLGLRIEDDVRQWMADRGALFTLLKNLLENAIQHSPAGGVVALTVRPGGFQVSDEGPGVKPEHLGRIFERFWRAPGGSGEGAGLGLAICAEIATAHAWRMQARSPGCGLEVTVHVGEAAPRSAVCGEGEGQVPAPTARAA